MATGDVKGKFKGTRAQHFELDFTVPLQLEECLHRLQHPQGTDRLLINLHYVTSGDHALYTAARYDGQTLIAHIEGRLERWEGTSTRVTGAVETTVTGIGDSCLWTVGQVILFLIMMAILNLAFQQPIFVSAPIRLFFACGGLVVVPAIAYFIITLLRQRWGRARLIAQLRAALAL